MSFKSVVTVAAIALSLGACGAEEPLKDAVDVAKEHEHSDHTHDASDLAEATKPKKDMKAMFGEDYKPGDIGHSFGEIVSIAPDGKYATIDHGEIHGINMGPMTMGFDALDSADLSAVSSGDNVEFVVKKGRDGSYRILSICALEPGQKKCLDG